MRMCLGNPYSPVFQRKAKASDAPTLFCLSSPALLYPNDEVKALLGPASLGGQSSHSVCRKTSGPPGPGGRKSAPSSDPAGLECGKAEGTGHRAGWAGLRRAGGTRPQATFERKRLPACCLPKGKPAGEDPPVPPPDLP